MQRPKLTNTAIEKFPSAAVLAQGRPQEFCWCGELRGFGVRWSRTSGTRAFIFQGRVKGSRQERIVTIGRYLDPYKVEQARAEAIRIKTMMMAGIDPVEQAKQAEVDRKAKAALAVGQNATLQMMLDEYLATNKTKYGKPLREATKQDYRHHIETELSDWLSKPVATINRDMVEARFHQISRRVSKASPLGAKQVANGTFVYLRAILTFAAEKYEVDGVRTILTTNPVTRALKRLKGLHKQVPRTRRIPLDRIGHVWWALRKAKASPCKVQVRTAVDLVQLRLLSGLRLSESGSLRWDQLNFNKKTIQLLPDVNKTHQSILLPMSDVLCEILQARAELPRDSEKAKRYVFPSPKADAKLPYMLNPTATMQLVIDAIGPDADGKEQPVSAHDFRRGLVTLARACGVDADDRRRLLTHKPEGTHGVNYDNEEAAKALRPAVDAIANYIHEAGRVAEAMETGTNIVKFPAKQA
jgi:integrase